MATKEINFELSDFILEKYFKETGKRQGWLNDNAAVLAVSGGGDSVALLWLFHKFYKGKIFVVHVNHGLRDNEADLDEYFVAKLAVHFGAVLCSKKIDVLGMKLKGESIETAARRLRRETICGIVERLAANFEFKINSVFLGHNRDDLAETVLFNILRGTGVRGSVGMTECTEYNGLKFYRPLLGLRREFLREILISRGIPWREDSTNSDDKYTRNFIRLNLLPLISSKINSSAVEHLATFGEDMRKIRTLEDKQGLELLTRCKESETPDLILTRKILRGLTNDERCLVIREVGRSLKLKTLSRERCTELANLIAKPSSFIFQWGNGMTVKSCKGKIIFIQGETQNAN